MLDAAASVADAPGLSFDETGHAYRFEGKPVPGVTSILAALLEGEDAPDEARRIAANRGRAVHKAIELDVAGDLDDSRLHPDIASRLRAWRKFRTEYGFSAGRAELRVYSRRYGYAGTLDLWGWAAGYPIILDAKATAAVPRKAHIQLAGYAQALRETIGSGPVRRAILHLRPDRYELVPCTDPNDFETFLACLTVKRWNDANAR